MTNATQIFLYLFPCAKYSYVQQSKCEEMRYFLEIFYMNNNDRSELYPCLNYQNIIFAEFHRFKQYLFK